MEKCLANRKLLADGIRRCGNTLSVLGDTTRQEIILALLDGESIGMRVGEIMKFTNLSRPAVSYHLKVLKDSEIISVYRKGTMNFYFLAVDTGVWEDLFSLTSEICEISKHARENGYPGIFREES